MRVLKSWINGWAQARAWPGLMLALWRREYQDVRIIVEQAGSLHYLSVPGRLQRLVVRGGLLAGVSLSTLVLLLGVSTVVLHQIREHEAKRHQSIYAALAGSFQEGGYTQDQQLSPEDMMELARSIRERDGEIRKLVASATNTLSMENTTFKSLLGGAGLTEKAIKIIQSGAAVGGFGPREGETSDLDRLEPLVNNTFLEEAADNRALKDIMMALPSYMPVNEHRMTSGFGIRKHPILGQPRLHPGVDLVPHTDDRVFPTKAGTVVLARDYSNYGYTVIVRHDRGIESLYAHLDKIMVKEGQQVDRETVLGMVGNTGASTGKHLHFEISVGGFPVDPLKAIRTAQHVQHFQK